MKKAFVGFDSAWSVRNQGAICYAICQGGDPPEVSLPELSDFQDAARIIENIREECDDVLVAIDQPIIVPNETGSRRVETVARSLMSPNRLRSGVQSANRNKASMFGDDAPVWRFTGRIGAPGYSGRTDRDDWREFVNFEAARSSTCQTHLIEVYPALALPALEPHFMNRRCAARYNPRRKTFRLDDWRRVCDTVSRCADEVDLHPLSRWVGKMRALEAPQKRDQDKVDAALCLIVALQWRLQTDGVCVIGNLETGYMVTPTSNQTRGILEAACRKRRVRFG